MCLFIFGQDYLEAILTMLELVLTSTLLDIVLEELRDFDILGAILANSDKFTLLG